LFLPRLKALGHEVIGIANYGLEAGTVEYDGVQWFPRLDMQYGHDAGIYWAKQFNADICISLYDAWVFSADLWRQNGVRWVPWFPVDSDPIAKRVVDQVKGAWAAIAYSKYGYEQAQAAGVGNLHYVPHGVDTGVYKPKDRAKAREELGWSNDLFYFAAVLNNKDNSPNRKAFAEQIEAFAMLHKRHPDIRFYLHTQADGTPYGGIDLVPICKHFELPDGAVLFTDQRQLASGQITDEEMAEVYNAADCLLSVTMGEGFGVPILEAQACGTPVIVGDWTAMSELCFAGWKVSKEDAHRYWVPTGACWYLPRPGAIYEAMEAALTSERYWPENTTRKVNHYDADQVTYSYWKPVLDQLQARIEAESSNEVYSFSRALEVV
jgi:glycosyltransferase involved in cell wall biosynthesis